MKKWQHIYPVKDSKQHNLEGLNCHCEPEIDWEYLLVVHNAFDMREVEEYINDSKESILRIKNET